MNQPKDRVSNKVNDVFDSFDALARMVERNREHLDHTDIEKIKQAIHYKLEVLIDKLNNPEESFKLDK